MEQVHTMRKYEYYDRDTLCSIIDVDFTTKQVRVENKVDSILDTAFGVNTEPTWDDFLIFLESRCIPRTRCGLNYYLDAVGVSEYDPIQLVEKTHGRMAEDHRIAIPDRIFLLITISFIYTNRVKSRFAEHFTRRVDKPAVFAYYNRNKGVVCPFGKKRTALTREYAPPAPDRKPEGWNRAGRAAPKMVLEPRR